MRVDARHIRALAITMSTPTNAGVFSSSNIARPSLLYHADQSGTSTSVRRELAAP
jgi:hypothetical protein